MPESHCFSRMVSQKVVLSGAEEKPASPQLFITRHARVIISVSLDMIIEIICAIDL